MKFKKSAIASALCAVACATCVGLYTVGVQDEANRAREETLERFGGEQCEAYVATRDLAAGEVLDSSVVASKPWISDLLPANPVVDLREYLGKRLGSPVMEGEVLSAGRFEESAGVLDVPEGLAAVSVPVKAVQAVGGSVEPGMQVDVYATGGSGTTLLVEKALVLASSASSEGAATVSTSVTLAVAPERVQEVVTAAQTLEIYLTLPAAEHPGEASAENSAAEDGAGGAGPDAAAETADSGGPNPEGTFTGASPSEGR